MQGTQLRNTSGAEGSFWNWGLDRIDSLEGRDNKYVFGNATGKGVRVYAMDTGVHVDHDDFGGRAVGGFSAGCQTGEEEACGKDWLYQGVITTKMLQEHSANSKFGAEFCDGHGTHTASTAAGTEYGVAKDATVVVVQTLNCKGEAANSKVLHAWEWVINDAKASGQRAVATLSLGGDYAEELNMGARNVAANGIPVIVAAGNEDTDACRTSPASEASAITVGATDEFDEAVSFSNWGACTTIFAPGKSITAAYPNADDPSTAAVLSGTSMATPHVAGAVAQILQLHPMYSVSDVHRALLCMASEGVVNGLDAYTPNRMLHTGEDLTTTANVELLGLQKLAPSNAGDGHAAENAPPRNKKFDEIKPSHDTTDTTDATLCHMKSHYGAEGHVVPQDERVTEQVGDLLTAKQDEEGLGSVLQPR